MLKPKYRTTWEPLLLPVTTRQTVSYLPPCPNSKYYWIWCIKREESKNVLFLPLCLVRLLQQESRSCMKISSSAHEVMVYSENLRVLVRTDKDEEYKLLDVRWKKKDGCPAHGCFKAGPVLLCTVALQEYHLCCSCVIPRQLCCNYYILYIDAI